MAWQLLEKQEAELKKAIEETEAELAARLEKRSPAEQRIRAEMERLTARLATLATDLEQVHIVICSPGTRWSL